MNPCKAPLPFDRLVAYHRGELGPEEQASVEDHYFRCATCTERLTFVTQLGRGIAALVTDGRISVAVTAKLLAQMESQGARVRTYRLQPGDAIACTASPQDHFVAVRLALDLAEDETVDIASTIEVAKMAGAQLQRHQDVPVDRTVKEVVLLSSGDHIRAIPRSRWTMYADVHGPSGDRRLGPFVLDHTP